MTTSSLKHAWRALLRTPAFTLTAVFTLVIGVGATVAIFSVVNRVLLQPLPYGDAERLVGAWHNMPPLSLKHVEQSAATYFSYQRHARTIEGIGVYQEGSANVADASGTGEPQRVGAGWISHTLIPVLQVPPLLGRSFIPEEDRNNGPDVVMISEGTWRTRFNSDPGVIGRTLLVNGLSRQIVGVMPERFRFPNAQAQLWLPIQLDPTSLPNTGFSFTAIARLKQGVSVDAAQRDFAAVLARVPEYFPDFAPGITTQQVMEQAKPQPLIVPLREDITGEIAKTLWMVFAAAGLVLLVACANVANLVLVRADARQRELAVREALGAGRARVMGHFLAESAILAGVAAIVGFGFAVAAVRALVAASPVELPRLAEVSVGVPEAAFTALVALLIAAACTMIPALRIGRVHLSKALREGGRAGTAGRTRQRIRGALVASQIALALVVLAASGLLIRTFQRLNAIEPGFKAENVATFWIAAPAAKYKTDSSISRFYSDLTARVAALPGVRGVGITSRLPLLNYGLNQTPFWPENDRSYDAKIPPLQLYTTVDSGYFSAMGIPIVAGRNFSGLGSQRENEAIVSLRTAQQFWNDSTGRAAVGKRFKPLPAAPWVTVIGVAGHTRDTSLMANPSQVVYNPQVPSADTLYSQIRSRMALVVRTAGAPAAIVPAVRAAVRELDPTLPLFEVRPMTAVVSKSMARLSFVIVMLGAAAIIALVLGAVGLYGVMAYLVTLRTRELGVRIALGAQPSAVAAMMTRHGLFLTAAGVVAGLAIFSGVARFLRSFLFGIAPSDPITLVGASLTLVAIAALATWIPARRASRVDPVEALRAD